MRHRKHGVARARLFAPTRRRKATRGSFCGKTDSVAEQRSAMVSSRPDRKHAMCRVSRRNGPDLAGALAAPWPKGEWGKPASGRAGHKKKPPIRRLVRWTYAGSNRGPPDCQSGALPAELQAHQGRYLALRCRLVYGSFICGRWPRSRRRRLLGLAQRRDLAERSGRNEVRHQAPAAPLQHRDAVGSWVGAAFWRLWQRASWRAWWGARRRARWLSRAGGRWSHFFGRPTSRWRKKPSRRRSAPGRAIVGCGPRQRLVFEGRAVTCPLLASGVLNNRLLCYVLPLRGPACEYPSDQQLTRNFWALRSV